MDAEKVPTPLPVGHSFFDRVIEGGYYYVDKTLFIRDILDKGATVTLCTRPRRFGKTLNQTMLKCFFEDTERIGGKDTRVLFRGLKIEKAGERYMGHQGRYPVVFLSFKEAKRGSFEEAYNRLRDGLVDEFKRHRYVFEKMSDSQDKALFEKLSFGDGTRDDYSTALKFLCKCLENHHDKKTIILIDEYDVPLENSWFRGFYQEMIDFIRPLLSSSLKDNPHLQLAVMTGCLRISKESIFTGLNNLDIVSILGERYDEYFGFTQGEIDAMLEYYGMESKTQIVRDWYNGYQFGRAEVYNPWSSVQVVDKWTDNINKLPAPYWANTSSNDIVRKLVVGADDETKAELEILMYGGTISKIVHEDITYDEIDKNADNLWNFLFFTGYLKRIGEGRASEDGELTLDLTIPNIELRYIYKTKIQEWFKESIKEKDFSTLYNAILDGDAETIERELEMLLMETISYMDSAENFYHGFMAGILSRLKGYVAKSNRESGHGRSDLVMYSVSGKADKAVIFELKTAKEFSGLSAACEEALKQIENSNYAAEWRDEGYSDIMKYGVAFYKKRCRVKKASAIR